MTTYKDAGVNIESGNEASAVAYRHAQSTFASRKGKLGEPVTEEGGYAGMLDMGDFFLVQNDDGTGTKMEVAVATDTYNTMGYDLLAMVADDAICTGAEVVSVSNTLDVARVDAEMVDRLMEGLAAACGEQKIVIPGGEIAEVPGSVLTPVWNATAVGIVAKDKVLKPETIKEGDKVIALRSGVARSNGFSLIRKILTEQIGETWTKEKWEGDVTWGEVMLTPSVIYHGALLHILGRYGEKRKIEIKGLAHITGGGIAENLSRTLKKSGCGAELSDLWDPHPALVKLIELGSVPIEDAYRTWCMGNGMMAVVDPADADKVIALLSEKNIEAKVAGTITKDSGVTLKTFEGNEI
jgi:phosphoribosylformylglycinamidine cyclo-ligase